MAQYYEPNAAYGQTAILGAYCGYTRPIAAVMARGLEIEPHRVFPGEIEVPVRAVMPWSEMRANAWRAANTGKEIIPSAAPFLYLDAMQTLTRSEDYTLFVPMHQTTGVTLTTDWYRLACMTRDLPQPVVVSMHESDWNEGHHKVFHKKGCDVICTGSYYFPLFLDNVARLIAAAKMVCSTNVSTHALYSVMMGKPVFMVGDRPKVIVRARTEIYDLYTTTPEGYAVETALYDLFGKEPTDIITPEQLAAARYHLGADNLKSPEGLRADLEYAESLMKVGRRKCQDC